MQDKQSEFESEVAKALAVAPNYGDVYRVAGEVAARNYRFDEAVALTRRALTLEPNNAQTLADLGLQLLRTGDEEAARTSLDKSFKIDGYDVVTLNLLTMMDTLDNFVTVRDGDVILRMHKDEAPILQDYAMPLAKQALSTLAAKYEFTPKGPILVEIFPKHDDFAVRTLGLPGMGAPGRFARARQLAKDAIGRAAAGELVGVLTFDDRAVLVAKPSVDRVLALSAIDETAPAFGGTRYRAALAAAGQAVAAAGRHQAKIVIVTDLQESGWDEGDRVEIPDYAKIELADVGAQPPNVAVTDVRVEPERVVATIHNTGRTRDVRARLKVDDRPTAEAVASVGEQQSADVNFPVTAHANC